MKSNAMATAVDTDKELRLIGGHGNSPPSKSAPKKELESRECKVHLLECVSAQGDSLSKLLWRALSYKVKHQKVSEHARWRVFPVGKQDTPIILENFCERPRWPGKSFGGELLIIRAATEVECLEEKPEEIPKNEIKTKYYKLDNIEYIIVGRIYFLIIGKYIGMISFSSRGKEKLKDYLNQLLRQAGEIDGTNLLKIIQRMKNPQGKSLEEVTNLKIKMSSPEPEDLLHVVEDNNDIKDIQLILWNLLKKTGTISELNKDSREKVGIYGFLSWIFTRKGKKISVPRARLEGLLSDLPEDCWIIEGKDGKETARYREFTCPIELPCVDPKRDKFPLELVCKHIEDSLLQWVEEGLISLPEAAVP